MKEEKGLMPKKWVQTAVKIKGNPKDTRNTKKGESLGKAGKTVEEMTSRTKDISKETKQQKKSVKTAKKKRNNKKI